MQFKLDQKLTLITISDFLATTQRREVKITRIHNDKPVYKAKGARKEYYLQVKPDMLVFDGWSVPFKIDTDTNQFSGNACYNFLVNSSPTLLKGYLLTKNLNTKFNQWDKITYELENLRGQGMPPLLFTQSEIESYEHRKSN